MFTTLFITNQVVEDKIQHQIIYMLEITLTVLLVDGMNIIFYVFMFRMKLVEIEIDSEAKSVQEVISRIQSL